MRILTISEVAARLGKSKRSIYRLIERLDDPLPAKDAGELVVVEDMRKKGYTATKGSPRGANQAAVLTTVKRASAPANGKANGHAIVEGTAVGVALNSEQDAGKASAYSKKLPRPKTVYVVDFFCGCGGMSWGFANTRLCNKLDPTVTPKSDATCRGSVHDDAKRRVKR